MVLFGVGLSLDVEHIPFVVLDQDKTQESRDYAARFSSGVFFNLEGELTDPKQLDELMANPKVLKVFHAARQDLEARVDPALEADVEVAAPGEGRGAAGFGDDLAPLEQQRHRGHDLFVGDRDEAIDPVPVDGEGALAGHGHELAHEPPQRTNVLPLAPMHLKGGWHPAPVHSFTVPLWFRGVYDEQEAARERGFGYGSR